MSNKFKEGDIVRCVSRRYRYTSYKRPCIVKGYDYSGKLLVEPFDDGGSVYDVDGTCFEIVPFGEILKTGQMIMVRDLDRQVKFNKYKNNGYIEVFDGEYHREYFADSIIFEEGFYI